MRDYILRNISAIYYTDANGVTVQCNLLDSDGISLLSGQTVEPPTLGPAIADRVYVVGSAPVTIDLSQRFIGASGYGMSPTNIPGVTRSGAIVTIDPATTRATTAITVSGTNTAGTATMTFNLTVNAVSPTLTTPLPDRSLTVGDAAVTLALGDYFANAASYSVSPTGQGVSISGSTLTISAAAERNGTYTVTASNSTGQTVSDAFALVVGAVPAPVDIAALSYAYIDTDTPHTLTSGEVTAIQAEGTGGLTLGLVGTGSANLITKVSDGFRFTTGRYLTVTGLTPGSEDGFLMLADVTFETATGTGQAINFGNTQIRRSTSTLQYTLPEWTSPTAQNVGTVTVPQRVVMAIEVNQVADNIRYWNPTTSQVEQRATTLSSLAPTTLTIGQAMTGTIHRVAVIRRPAGQQLPITLEEAVANFSGGDVTPPAQVVTIHYDEGQSLALGPNDGATLAPNGQQWRTILGAQADVRMLSGLVRLDGQAITSVAAPLGQRYNLAAPATGDTPALISGNVPGGMVIARAMLRDGVEEAPIGFQFHGQGGQEINNFLPGTALYENAEHWLTQAVAVWGEAE